ncbi:MAG: response regulator, partial [Cyanobium sp. ELA712]
MNHLPDLIICDILMRGMDGYEVLAELLKMKETRAIPFIFLTAKVEREDIRKGMELGADDYLFKPFKPEELLTAITTRLQKRSLIKANYIEIDGIKKDDDQNRIFLNLGEKSCFVSKKEIVYISAENQYAAI